MTDWVFDSSKATPSSTALPTRVKPTSRRPHALIFQPSSSTGDYACKICELIVAILIQSTKLSKNPLVLGVPLYTLPSTLHSYNPYLLILLFLFSLYLLLRLCSISHSLGGNGLNTCVSIIIITEIR